MDTHWFVKQSMGKCVVGEQIVQEFGLAEFVVALGHGPLQSTAVNTVLGQGYGGLRHSHPAVA